MIFVVDVGAPRLKAERDVENLRAFVEDPGIALDHFRVGVCTVEEEMALFLCVDGRGIFPIAINVQVLVVEACGRVVPLGHFDGAHFVRDVNDVEAIRAAVGVVVLWNGVQIAVGQFVVHEDPVVVGCDLNVDHAANFSVIGRKEYNVVWLGDVQNLKLVVR